MSRTFFYIYVTKMYKNYLSYVIRTEADTLQAVPSSESSGGITGSLNIRSIGEQPQHTNSIQTGTDELIKLIKMQTGQT